MVAYCISGKEYHSKYWIYQNIFIKKKNVLMIHIILAHSISIKAYSVYLINWDKMIIWNIIECYIGWDSSVGKSSASQAGDPGSNPGEGLTCVTQCMNEMGKSYIASVSLTDWCIMIVSKKKKNYIFFVICDIYDIKLNQWMAYMHYYYQTKNKLKLNMYVSNWMALWALSVTCFPPPIIW